jgi:flagellar FliJ protein
MSTARNTATHWNLLVHVAEQGLEECGRRLVGQVAQRDEASRKLQVLVDYRRMYREQREGAQRTGIAAGDLRNYQSFVASLEQATEQQSDRLTEISKAIFDTKGEIRELQRKIHSYRVLQERRDAGERIRDRRRQQGLQDEMASRMRVAR